MEVGFRSAYRERERGGERKREGEGGGEKSSPETDGASQKVRAG